MKVLKKISFPSLQLVAMHAIMWLLTLQLEFDMLGLLESALFFIEGERSFDGAFILIPSLVFLFYWNCYYLLPRFFSKKTWWKYLTALIVCFLILLTFGSTIVSLLIDAKYETEYDDFLDFFDNSFILHLVVVGISSSLGIYQIAKDNEQEKEHAEAMQKEAELKYLNAQINPHFLQNTLNGIYAQALEEEADKTTELIMQLSELMRYSLKYATKKSIALRDEFTFLESYINLQKERLGEDYPIFFEKHGEYNSGMIAPFMMIPIIENAFKYGISQKRKSPLSFRLEVKGSELVFSSMNHKTSSDKVESHLIGISNLRSRLNLVYAGKHSLIISNNEEIYNVELKLQLN